MKPEGRPIALARITGQVDRSGFYPITIGGDGLRELKAPFEAKLFKPEYTGADLNHILEVSRFGPNENGEYYTIQIKKIKLKKNKGRLLISGNLPENISGMWITIDSSKLTSKEDEFYVFEIMDLPIYLSEPGEKVGKVVECLFTGAHGVIEIKMIDLQIKKTILVPMVSEFVDFTKNRDGLVIPDLYDFIVE